MNLIIILFIYHDKKDRGAKKDRLRERVWSEMDNLEEELFQESDSNEKRTKVIKKAYKKPDKDKKVLQIRAYEDALRVHQKSFTQFYDPLASTQIPLNIEGDRIVQLIEQARNEDKNVPFTLRSIGLKKMKILLKHRAIEQFESIIEYIQARKIPQWMKIKYEEQLGGKS